MLNRLALLLLLWLAPGNLLLAHEHAAPGIEILEPWAPVMAEDLQLVYLTIRNRGSMADRLMRVQSPGPPKWNCTRQAQVMASRRR